VIISQPFNSIAFTFDGIFKGLGEAVYLRNTLISGTILIFLPVLLYLDYLEYEIISIWIAMMGWMIYRGGLLLWKFNRMTKQPMQ
jgi:Na+-driven multidrug efflux pump